MTSRNPLYNVRKSLNLIGNIRENKLGALNENALLSGSGTFDLFPRMIRNYTRIKEKEQNNES